MAHVLGDLGSTLGPPWVSPSWHRNIRSDAPAAKAPRSACLWELPVLCTSEILWDPLGSSEILWDPLKSTEIQLRNSWCWWSFHCLNMFHCDVLWCSIFKYYTRNLATHNTFLSPAPRESCWVLLNSTTPRHEKFASLNSLNSKDATSWGKAECHFWVPCSAMLWWHQKTLQLVLPIIIQNPNLKVVFREHKSWIFCSTLQYHCGTKATRATVRSPTLPGNRACPWISERFGSAFYHETDKARSDDALEDLCLEDIKIHQKIHQKSIKNPSKIAKIHQKSKKKIEKTHEFPSTCAVTPSGRRGT